jgi:hypothetical protein
LYGSRGGRGSYPIRKAACFLASIEACEEEKEEEWFDEKMETVDKQ